MPQDFRFSDDKIFEQLATTAGLSVCLMEADGTIVYVNETATKVYGGGTVEEHIGRRLDEVYPPEWAREKIALLRRVAESGERLVIRFIWNGKRVEAQYQRVDADTEGPTRILVIAREGITDDELLPEDFKIVTTGTAHFGPLAVLSPRELEVLALIGQGKSAKQIGEILTLSPRTVERHRDSIGKKLQKRDRVSLALIAQAAGLELRDAHLTPVDPMLIQRPSRTGLPSSEIEAKPDAGRKSPRV
ncbi:MAG: LuxR C-terminal-related transcriptional regulator [Planctomycetota bacterium]|nr:LuxR C-terminal-related transcriptional regulator [Planctomycetota bacterium]